MGVPHPALMRQMIGGALDDLVFRIQPQIFADLVIESIILTYIDLSMPAEECGPIVCEVASAAPVA